MDFQSGRISTIEFLLLSGCFRKISGTLLFLVEVLTEEPFIYAKDSVEYKIHLMVWKQEGKNRKVEIETIDER